MEWIYSWVFLLYPFRIAAFCVCVYPEVSFLNHEGMFIIFTWSWHKCHPPWWWWHTLWIWNKNKVCSNSYLNLHLSGCVTMISNGFLSGFKGHPSSKNHCVPHFEIHIWATTQLNTRLTERAIWDDYISCWLFIYLFPSVSLPISLCFVVLFDLTLLYEGCILGKVLENIL